MALPQSRVAEITLSYYPNIKLNDCANRVLGISAISKGGVTGTVVDPKIVYGLALKAVACGIILAHNHPSGNLKPSHADIKLTEKLASAGKIFDLPILDHLIMTGESYYSFADNGEPCLS